MVLSGRQRTTASYSIVLRTPATFVHCVPSALRRRTHARQLPLRVRSSQLLLALQNCKCSSNRKRGPSTSISFKSFHQLWSVVICWAFLFPSLISATVFFLVNFFRFGFGFGFGFLFACLISEVFRTLCTHIHTETYMATMRSTPASRLLKLLLQQNMAHHVHVRFFFFVLRRFSSRVECADLVCHCCTNIC